MDLIGFGSVMQTSRSGFATQSFVHRKNRLFLNLNSFDGLSMNHLWMQDGRSGNQ